MLKLFKAKKTITAEQIIAEIHNEFDSASERLLLEAKNIVTKDSSKGDRLARLGFAKAMPVQESEDARKAQREAKDLAELVSYYGQWYPHNKFITEAAVDKICEKYGLVFADARFYKGDVPEKNLIEMERFVVRKEDKVQDWTSLFTESLQSLTNSLLRRRGFGDLQNQWGEITTPAFPSEEKATPKSEFKICAPEKDFDTSSLTKKGHKLELNIPDPIVLQQVKGGYLIVAKWGLEASDDLVKNEKSN